MYVSIQGDNVVITAFCAITQLSNSLEAEIQSIWFQLASNFIFSYIVCLNCIQTVMSQEVVSKRGWGGEGFFFFFLRRRRKRCQEILKRVLSLFAPLDVTLEE